MQIYEITEGILKGVATPVAKPARAGFATNAAEYFANQILNKAGIPQDQQGQYDPTGHMAAKLGQGSTSIRQQEISIANQLSDEWLRSRTLNGKLVPNPSDEDYIEAAKLTNTASRTNLPVNYKNILADIDKLKNQKNAAAQQQKTGATSTTATADKTPEQTRIEKQKAAAAAAQQQMTGATTVTPTPLQVGPGVRPQMTVSPSKVSFNTNLPTTEPAKTSTANPMSSMVTQLTNKPVASSTGGKITTTPTGLVHTAKPAVTTNPAAPADPVAAAANVMAKQKAAAKSGMNLNTMKRTEPGLPSSDEYAKLEKRIQQAKAAQGQKA